MLIWINGPGGVGKTQVAHELAYRLPGGFVCDPEPLGFAIQRMIPPPLRTDFQAFPQWRSGVVAVLDDLLSRHDGVVIVPGTILDEDHLDEIVGGLRRRGHDVHHVCMLASRETLRRRLRSRADGRGSYAAARIDTSLAALARPAFATHVRTDGLSVSEVAEEVARLTGLELGPPGSRVRQRLRRTWVTLRQIR